MTYHNDWLTEKYQRGERMKFLFFWGHAPAKDGSVTQSCFSQWWPAPFDVTGIRYTTAEHWMMAEKAWLCKDEAALDQILAAKSPAQAKALGRTITGFDAALWDARKSDIVTTGNFHKFSQHEALKHFLLGTGDRVLVEASPVDRIWGIGLAVDNIDIENPLKWKGENRLGYALMEVRDMLSQQNTDYLKTTG